MVRATGSKLCRSERSKIVNVPNSIGDSYISKLWQCFVLMHLSVIAIKLKHFD
jgi:hypothetical protein